MAVEAFRRIFVNYSTSFFKLWPVIMALACSSDKDRAISAAQI
jgi:hypothetical protein